MDTPLMPQITHVIDRLKHLDAPWQLLQPAADTLFRVAEPHTALPTTVELGENKQGDTVARIGWIQGVDRLMLLAGDTGTAVGILGPTITGGIDRDTVDALAVATDVLERFTATQDSWETFQLIMDTLDQIRELGPGIGAEVPGNVSRLLTRCAPLDIIVPAPEVSAGDDGTVVLSWQLSTRHQLLVQVGLARDALRVTLQPDLPGARATITGHLEQPLDPALMDALSLGIARILQQLATPAGRPAAQANNPTRR